MVKVTKKITKRLPVTAQAVAAEEVKVEKEVVREVTQDERSAVKIKKCMFCVNKSEPAYTDVATIKRFLSDRAKIASRLRSGVCSKHQRGLGKHIKYGRHLLMLPFTPKI